MSTDNKAVELWFRFFDIDVKLASDSEFLLDMFGQVFHRFQIDATAARPAPLSFFILSQPRRGRQAFLIIDRDVWPLPEPELMPGYVFQRMSTAIAARVRSHLLFHGGVVTHAGQAVILAGDAFHGRTTLVLELVRQGARFLSDETAAVSRASGQAFPFPRALQIRPGSLNLAGFAANNIEGTEWFGKKIIDIEQLKPGRLAQAAPVGRVVVLRRPNETDTTRRELVLVLDRIDDAFLADIRQIKGVLSLSTASQYRYPVLKLITNRKTLASARIEALCDEHRILMLDVRTGASTTPNFSGPAKLTPISTSQAALELLQRFEGGFQSAILQETGPAALFLEISRWLKQAKCFQLTTGPLPEVASQVCRLIGLRA